MHGIGGILIVQIDKLRLSFSGLFSGAVLSSAFIVFSGVAPAYAVNCALVSIRPLTTLCDVDLSSEKLVATSHLATEAVRKTLSSRFFAFDGEVGVVEALGFAAETTAESPEALSDFDAASQHVPIWNAWVDAAGIYSDRTSAAAGFQGTVGLGSVGVDAALGDGSTIVGGFASVGTSFYNTQSTFGAGTARDDSAGIGAYIGQLIGDSLFANAVVQYAHANNSFSVGATGGSYGSDNLALAASLTGFFQYDYFRLSPAATLSYATVWQDGYIETTGAVSPARRTDVGTLFLGTEAGYTFANDNGQAIEPWIGAGLDVTLYNSTTPATPASPDSLGNLNAKISGGFNAALSDSVSLSIRGDVGGLTTANYMTYGVGGQLSARF